MVKSLSLDPSFKKVDLKKFLFWVYSFLIRFKLSCRLATRIYQKLSGHLQAVRKDSVQQLTKRFWSNGLYENVHLLLFINKDETTIYFALKPNSTVHEVGAGTVPMKCSGGRNKRSTVCVFIASNGDHLPDHLPLLLIFKWHPGYKIEWILNYIVPENVCGFFQSRSWMDNLVWLIWIEKVWESYVAVFGNSVQLLNDFACYKQESCSSGVQEFYKPVDLIPGRYKSFLQPRDGGAKRSLKISLKKTSYVKWGRGKLCWFKWLVIVACF